mmetsp:Transcript_10657/g.27113  ORF Transcript_10657/g.27113 Transcript_10657/m.27113 type:complete len:134 (-) Transcript_10657:24-425(-)
MPREAKDDDDAKGESIVSRVSTYFFRDATFSHRLEAWVESKASEIDLEQEELRLGYTDLYDEFKSLYEGMLEDYIAAQGYSIKEFYEELRAAVDRDPDGSEAMLGQIILATTDFDVFMHMMRDYRQQQQSRHK